MKRQMSRARAQVGRRRWWGHARAAEEQEERRERSDGKSERAEAPTRSTPADERVAAARQPIRA